MRDLKWLKEEIKVDVYNLYWKGKIGSNERTNLLSRISCLIDQVEQLDVPAIPGYVAEWLEENQHKYESIIYFANDYYNGDVQANVSHWILENNKEFSIAWSTGYTIEAKKYYARIKGADQHFARDNPTYLKREVKDKGYELVYLKVDADLISKEQWKEKGVTEDIVDFEGR